MPFSQFSLTVVSTLPACRQWFTLQNSNPSPNPNQSHTHITIVCSHIQANVPQSILISSDLENQAFDFRSAKCHEVSTEHQPNNLPLPSTNWTWKYYSDAGKCNAAAAAALKAGRVKFLDFSSFLPDSIFFRTQKHWKCIWKILLLVMFQMSVEKIKINLEALCHCSIKANIFPKVKIHNPQSNWPNQNCAVNL